MGQQLQNFEEKAFVNQEFCSASNYLPHLKPTELLNEKIYHLVHFLGKKILKGISISVYEVVYIRINLMLKNCESQIK